jgi:hypothetical protein
MTLTVLKEYAAARMSVANIVDEGAALDAQMKRDALRMAEIKTALVEKGPGEYFGTKGDRALVIYPAARIAPKPEIIEDVRKAIGNPAFGTLFERVILWKPVKSCRDVATRILPTTKLKKFFQLAESESPAQVRFG